MLSEAACSEAAGGVQVVARSLRLRLRQGGAGRQRGEEPYMAAPQGVEVGTRVLPLDGVALGWMNEAPTEPGAAETRREMLERDGYVSTGHCVNPPYFLTVYALGFRGC